MRLEPWAVTIALTLALGARQTEAACQILDSRNAAASGNHDALALLLAREKACPQDVLELRALLGRAGARLQPTLVANRGFHNPAAGSFSVFEIVSGTLAQAGPRLEPGDLLLGHFTAPGPAGQLVLDQTPQDGSLLMVELIAWDEPKGLFNFYELIGEPEHRRWFYRGDSGDILADVAPLHRVDGPQFGARLRCSGCHLAGGPILKELSAPHNDWWRTSRPLGFGGRTPDRALLAILAGLEDADVLAAAVEAGGRKLSASPRFRALRERRSLQEQLRPLFCPEQLNLASDTEPGDSGAASVQIPAAFLLDPRLAGGTLAASREHSQQALSVVGARFPETDRRDGDHAWLAPVKAAADQAAVVELLAASVVDQELVADTLAVDMTNPVFSSRRCALLRLVPEQAAGWRPAFEAALRRSPDAAAAELLQNLTDPARDAAFHKRRAEALLEACRTRLATSAAAAAELYRLLAVRRAEAFASPISSNPRGQILEPGFRVIFPVLQPAAVAGSATLTEACEVVGSAGRP